MTDNSAFWDWSTDIYARPGVENALLTLQDKFALSVNINLWCCWCADRYQSELSELQLRKAIDEMAPFQANVTGPLRAVRRYLKTVNQSDDAQSVRATVKEAELGAEKLEQEQLCILAARFLDNGAPSPDAELDANAGAMARRSLARYASLSRARERGEFLVSDLEALLQAVFPDIKDRIEQDSP